MLYVMSCCLFGQSTLGEGISSLWDNETESKSYVLVRFLVLVTTMVTKVDHSNYHSNDRSNHCGYYDGYYNRYLDGNTFFLQKCVFSDGFLWFSITFDSFHI